MDKFERFPPMTEEFNKLVQEGKWRSRGFVGFNIPNAHEVLASYRKSHPDIEWKILMIGHDHHLYEKVTKNTIFLPNPNTLDIGDEER